MKKYLCEINFRQKRDLKHWIDYYKEDIKEGKRVVTEITIPIEDVLAIYRIGNYREVHIVTKRAKTKVIS